MKEEKGRVRITTVNKNWAKIKKQSNRDLGLRE
jgi:hypothetical protein